MTAQIGGAFLCGRGGITDLIDRHEIETFRAFLHHCGACGFQPGTRDRPAVLPDTFEAREFLATWDPYMRGQYPGPVEANP